MFSFKRLLHRVAGRRVHDDDAPKFPPSSGLPRRHRRQPLIRRTETKQRVSAAYIERLLRLGISGRVVRLLPTERTALARLTAEARSRGYSVTVRPEPDVINVYIRGRA
jgi:hypothetical protein